MDSPSMGLEEYFVIVISYTVAAFAPFMTSNIYKTTMHGGQTGGQTGETANGFASFAGDGWCRYRCSVPTKQCFDQPWLCTFSEGDWRLFM